MTITLTVDEWEAMKDENKQLKEQLEFIRNNNIRLSSKLCNARYEVMQLGDTSQKLTKILES